MPSNPNILISGAGIAGLTLAYWLQRYGFQPAIVEKRPNLSNAGYMIDFYGSGIDVAERMGILDALKATQYPISGLTIVDRDGKPQVNVELGTLRKLLHGRYMNVMRGDLASVIYQCVADSVPVKWGSSIDRLSNQPDHVGVQFSDGTSGSYDLVIGADGIHSRVRDLLWGPESQFEHYLGFYVACAVIDRLPMEQPALCTYIEPHKQASVYPIHGDRLATFLTFASERQNVQTREQQIDLLQSRMGGMGWRVPDLLQAMSESPHLYFDAVAQIKLDQWHQGRAALIGDACQCLTLLAGQGASMAMAGAYILAQELQRFDGDYQQAFQGYQAQLKPEIDKRQGEARKLAKTFVPDNLFQIRLLGWFLKLSHLPGFGAILRRQIGAKSILK
jgi:2-polyprenyl-6-methoxyphenol hydroxylase-like FAD-dependent oxidoreductase